MDGTQNPIHPNFYMNLVKLYRLDNKDALAQCWTRNWKKSRLVFHCSQMVQLNEDHTTTLPKQHFIPFDVVRIAAGDGRSFFYHWDAYGVVTSIKDMSGRYTFGYHYYAVRVKVFDDILGAIDYMEKKRQRKALTS